ncbi:hypothetical protein AAP_01813 [Ascosphaera apis ARSEF 7405]|uniref:Uncharacterized protein n=1 Tax=Ascosphaera apis ARSEF 7405 TaxID=392613 RepID=A0A162IJV5_9EURO|nr:hypothetical protein AAP_01813 [Ascosphaera apis ARSEF 7405]
MSFIDFLQLDEAASSQQAVGVENAQMVEAMEAFDWEGWECGLGRLLVEGHDQPTSLGSPIPLPSPPSSAASTSAPSFPAPFEESMVPAEQVLAPSAGATYGGAIPPSGIIPAAGAYDPTWVTNPAPLSDPAPSLAVEPLSAPAPLAPGASFLPLAPAPLSDLAPSFAMEPLSAPAAAALASAPAPSFLAAAASPLAPGLVAPQGYGTTPVVYPSAASGQTVLTAQADPAAPAQPTGAQDATSGIAIGPTLLTGLPPLLAQLIHACTSIEQLRYLAEFLHLSGEQMRNLGPFYRPVEEADVIEALKRIGSLCAELAALAVEREQETPSPPPSPPPEPARPRRGRPPNPRPPPGRMLPRDTGFETLSRFGLVKGRFSLLEFQQLAVARASDPWDAFTGYPTFASMVDQYLVDIGVPVSGVMDTSKVLKN